MCGIFGVIGMGQRESDLERGAKSLSHRGPDQFGSLFDEEQGVYLAHARLSIIDLSDAGRQPMCNEDGSIWLVYNGEIYNFKSLRRDLERLGHCFKSETDSEVVVHAYEEWGDECVQKFNGMFAFAIWDRRLGRLFLARDRVGIKPLYYAQLGDKFIFASEPKAIINLPFYSKGISPNALQSYLIYRYVAGEKSIWKGVNKLKAGHVMTYLPITQSVSDECYWELGCTVQKWSFDDAFDQFNELIESAVSSRLVSDVPLGVFLSGGMDSTVVAGVASKVTPRLDTFSMGFEGWSRNELPIARKSAQIFETNYHEDIIDSRGFDDLQEVFRIMDEPLGDTSILPTLQICKSARRHAKVVLSGDGGDELFGGYKWYMQTERSRLRKRFLFFLGDMLTGAGVQNFPNHKRCSKFHHYMLMTSPGFTNDELRKLFPDIFGELSENKETYLYERHFPGISQKYKNWQHVDFHTFLLENNLMKIDRISMACSLEVRVPLLDHRMVEFAFSLPDRLCIQGAQQKVLLQQMLRKLRASHVLEQPKLGFSAPMGMYWPQDNMRELLLSSYMVKDGLMNPSYLNKIVKYECENNSQYSYKLWLLSVLEMWYRNWF